MPDSTELRSKERGFVNSLENLYLIPIFILNPFLFQNYFRFIEKL